MLPYNTNMKSFFHCVFLFAWTTAVALAASTFDCPSMAKRVCDGHINDNIIYCGSDGKHYPNLCSFWTKSCSTNISIQGTGPHCTPYHPPTVPTTTEPPLTPFTRALYKAISRGIDDRLIRTFHKQTPAEKAKLIFSKQDHKNKIYVRNTECWAYGLDLTCMSPWNDEHGIRKAGTLVSPRHAVWARHYNIVVNTTIRFVDANNIVTDRRVVATRFVDMPSDSYRGRDIVVGVLDQDVPSTIGFARVLPRNLTTIIAPHRTQRLPTLSTDFEEKALVGEFNAMSNTYGNLLEPSVFSYRHLFYEPKINGDSGDPTFFVINNDLVLLFVFTTGAGTGGGTPIVHYYDKINSLMDQLGGGYHLTYVNLQQFLHDGESVPSIIG